MTASNAPNTNYRVEGKLPPARRPARLLTAERLEALGREALRLASWLDGRAIRPGAVSALRDTESAVWELTRKLARVARDLELASVVAPKPKEARK